jgi:hypothetical protein
MTPEYAVALAPALAEALTAAGLDVEPTGS